jgi:exodeoxyribonuclease VII small subunit
VKGVENQKEELLSLLTEIYDQLGELERKLETEMSAVRGQKTLCMCEKVKSCENQISHLQNRYFHIRNRSQKPGITSKNITLPKLGY